MIKLKRLNGKEFVVNCEMIEFVESTPDTVVTLGSGNKIVVRDTIDEVIDKVIQYKKSINARPNVIKRKVIIESLGEK